MKKRRMHKRESDTLKRDVKALLSDKERLIQYALTLLALLPPLYYIFGPMAGLLHSDFTDTIYWAQTTVESGRMLDPAFSYAGLLPFGAQLWLVPLVASFGMTMTVQRIGLVIFLLLFVFAITFLAKTMGLSPIWRGLSVLIINLGISQSEKTLEIMWGHVIYYSLGSLLFFLGFGLLLRSLGFFTDQMSNRKGGQDIWEGERKRRTRAFILFMLLSIGAATNGFQGMAMYMLPFAGALVLERVFEPRSTLRDRASKDQVLLALSLLAATFVGLIILAFMMRGGVSAPYAKAYSMYSDSTRWGANLGRLLPSFLRLFEIQPKPDDLIFNPLTLAIPFKLLATALLIVVPIVLTKNYQRQRKPLRLLLLAHWIQTAIILYTFIFGLLSSAPWRLVPPIISSLFIVVVATYDLFHAKRETSTTIRYRMAQITLFVFLIFATFGALKIFSYPPHYVGNVSQQTLLTSLDERDLRNGYASFWNAQSVNLLSDGRIKIRAIEPTDKGIVKRHYQTRSTWFDDVPGVDRYFLALAAHEISVLEDAGQLESVTKDALESFEAGPYTVFIYADNLFSNE